MSVSITFLGGPETGDVDSVKWGGGPPDNLEITFAKDKAVTIDLDKAKNSKERAFFDHVIKKASGNRFFKVSGGDKPADKKPEDKHVEELPRRGPGRPPNRAE